LENTKPELQFTVANYIVQTTNWIWMLGGI